MSTLFAATDIARIHKIAEPHDTIIVLRNPGTAFAPNLKSLPLCSSPVSEKAEKKEDEKQGGVDKKDEEEQTNDDPDGNDGSMMSGIVEQSQV